MKNVSIVVVVTMALVVSGCSHGRPPISNDAAKALQATVAQVRVSASNRDVPAAAAELATLRNQVAELERNAQVSADAAQKILDAANVVAQNLTVITTTTRAPREHSHGKGNGNDSGDGGD